MADYYSLTINYLPAEEYISDLMADTLADIGYEMFETNAGTLKAYVPASMYSAGDIDSAFKDIPGLTSYDAEAEFVESQDWNAEWEKHYFKPIVIENQCVVHSSFHKDIPQARYDIVIDPKMAFGTGHHSTTHLMMDFILGADIQGHDIIDMGTGTGILSILASMCGARHIDAIEIDRDACINARENIALNQVDANIIHGDASALETIGKADYLFANINRNIILNDINAYAKAIRPGGEIFLSGFYVADIEIIEHAATPLGLRLKEIKEDNGWAAIRLAYIPE